MSIYTTILTCAGILFALTVVVSHIAASRLVARLGQIDPDRAASISHPLIVWGETSAQDAFENFVVARDSDKYNDSIVTKMAFVLRLLRAVQGILLLAALAASGAHAFF